ncbi:MAG: hypothetical protein Q7J35_13530 [Candidatus Methanoperedens sp.]|nr:hypothetical protein [Candidatus Methanoperedens sp.]
MLDEAVEEFYDTAKKYCSKNGSHDSILGWGDEKTCLSIFSRGINTNNRYCFLEMGYRVPTDKEKFKTRRVDAFIMERSKSKTLTGIIEAKKVNIDIVEKITEGKINQIKRQLEKIESQLSDIDQDVVYSSEEKGVKSHSYRIGLIFIVLRARFAKSGKGKKIIWYDFKDIKLRVNKLSDAIDDLIEGDHIASYYPYIYSDEQFNLIKDYYGTTLEDEDIKIDRPHSHTYYEVGSKVIAAIF